jgi:hypothetical protein
MEQRDRKRPQKYGQLVWYGFEAPLSRDRGKAGKTGETGEEFDLLAAECRSSMGQNGAVTTTFSLVLPVSRIVPAVI